MAASTAMTAHGQVRQGQAAAEAGRANRATAYAEAEYRDQQAEQEVAAASVNNQRIADRMKAILAENTANAAAGGGAADATVMAIQKDVAGKSVLDQMREMAMAETRADQIRYGAEMTRRQGDIDYAMGQEAKKASYLQAGGTLIQGGMSWYDKFGSSSAAPATTPTKTGWG